MSKVILITGTSSGFGRLTTLALLSEGHKVYATMRNSKGANANAAKELTQAGATVLDLDVTDTTSIQAATNILLANEKTIDVLINNAGIAAAGISESFSADQAQKLFDVNVFGVLRVTQAVLPAMRQQKDGLIINVGSILGRVTFPFFGLYGASKYAVEAMTDSFAYEVSQLGIDVVMVQPSAYPTNMYASAITPTHESIVKEYGEVADIPVAISNTIASMFEGDGAPQPTDIANAVTSLVNQAKGARARRTVVGTSFGAEAVNAEVAPIQSQLMAGLDLSSLEIVK